MPKETGNRRFSAIPLPPTVVDAWSPVERQECVSHSVKLAGGDGSEQKEGSEAPELTSDNHAFYVGKLIPNTVSERIRRLLGWRLSREKIDPEAKEKIDPEERMYNKEFFAGALESLFTNLQEGQKARVVVCRSLSELINGPNDVEHALTSEQEICLIKRIAKRKFRKTENSLEVVDLEKQPQHEALFRALRASVKPETGRADIEKALADNEDEQSVIAETNSLRIAKMLFKAAAKSENLRKAFSKTIPDKLEDSAPENPDLQYYSLIEVAIRLGDILNGIYIHGGSNRQAIYNGIIIQLIRGKEGRYKDIEELKPLFEMLKGLRFETLHLDNEKNYYRFKKIQSLARCRMLIYAALLVGVVAGGVIAGKWHERGQQKRRQDEVNELLRERLDDITFYIDRFEMDKKHNVNKFHEITNEILNDLKLRYQFSQDMCDELKPFLQKYLLDNKHLLGSIYRVNSIRMDMADLFIQKHDLYFKNRGIETGRPYQHLYHYIPIFRVLLESDEDVSFRSNPADNISGTPIKNVENIGTFVGGEDYGWEYEFYLYKADGKSHIVARDRVNEEYGSQDKCFTSKRAKKGAAAFFRMIERYDTLPLDGFNSQIRSMTYWLKDDKDRQFCEKRSEKKSKSTDFIYRPVVYADFFRRYVYEVIKYQGYDSAREQLVDCLLARTLADTHFTHWRMNEVAERYKKAHGGGSKY